MTRTICNCSCNLQCEAESVHLLYIAAARKISSNKSELKEAVRSAHGPICRRWTVRLAKKPGSSQFAHGYFHRQRSYTINLMLSSTSIVLHELYKSHVGLRFKIIIARALRPHEVDHRVTVIVTEANAMDCSSRPCPELCAGDEVVTLRGKIAKVAALNNHRQATISLLLIPEFL